MVADNCTDQTTEIAIEHGAEVFTTVANTEKKAGALNQALAELFQEMDTHDVVMVMDADSTVVSEFLETAMGRLEADPELIAVGGVFYGEEGSGLIGQLQRNEYTRYQRDISRRKGRVFVLTGTASLFRTYALKAVADSRGELLPGDPGTVYDTLALTEDNEMTLSLRTLGAKMVSPMQCHVITEVMPDWRLCGDNGCAGNAAHSKTSVPTASLARPCATGCNRSRSATEHWRSTHTYCCS